jgi:hypothetical protein
MRISKWGLCAGLAGALLVLAAPAANAARVGIVLYQEDNYGGDSRALTDDQPNLGWIHFDDRISSLEVRHGVWELCTDSQYRGRCITVDHDVAKLSRLGFDDKISSVHRVR